MTINAKKCPICQKENNCGNELGKPTCWCSEETFPEGIFALVPDEMRNKACICKDCLERFAETEG
ncbi:cysteine-rich CWC family protein [Bacillus tianshenii]|nr:cysteine-rich CWC family protein [Bacillus tianshenii]